MTTTIFALGTTWGSPAAIPTSHSEQDRLRRIQAALGYCGEGLPEVNAKTLRRYYRHLKAVLRMPMIGCYPEATNATEADEFRLSVIELLDPAKYLGDEIDGLFVKTQKGKYEINLPLIEIALPQNCCNWQHIADYSYWLRNSHCR